MSVNVSRKMSIIYMLDANAYAVGVSEMILYSILYIGT